MSWDTANDTERSSPSMPEYSLEARLRFLPLLFPIATLIYIAVTLAGLFIYVYIQEKQKAFEREQDAKGSISGEDEDAEIDLEHFDELQESDADSQIRELATMHLNDLENEDEDKRPMVPLAIPLRNEYNVRVPSFSLPGSLKTSTLGGFMSMSRPKVHWNDRDQSTN